MSSLRVGSEDRENKNEQPSMNRNQVTFLDLLTASEEEIGIAL